MTHQMYELALIVVSGFGLEQVPFSNEFDQGRRNVR